jgi:type VI secretion system protein VasJ
METSPIIKEIEQSIGEGNPCGEDITYDEAFQQIKTMIDSGVTVGGRIDQEKALRGGEESIVSEKEGTDFDRIVELSREILRSKSKDIRVSCYLALGLFHTKGVVGMAEGLTGLHRLITTYWEDMYPAKRRARARSSAVKFLADRLDDRLKVYQPTADDRELLEESLEVLETLQMFLLDELEEEAPALSSFKKTLTELIRRVPDSTGENGEGQAGIEETLEGPDEETEEEAKRLAAEQKTARQAQRPESISETESGYQGENDAYSAVLQAAAFLCEQDRTSTVPYRLSRTVRWVILRSEPPHENGKTNIPPPEEQRCSYVAGLLDKGQYLGLLQEAESIFREPPFHFWLDLQRMLTAGMEALGPAYSDVRETVMTEMALLVGRIPNLPELTFNDGTPFADALTREWIELEVATVRDGKQDESTDEREAVEGDRLAARFEEARGQLTRGDLSAALNVMNDGRGEDGSKKNRFRRQLYLASLCMKGGQPTVARPILEQLEEEIHRHDLEAWDPRLALTVWTDLYNCYEALAGSSAVVDKQMVRERAAHVFERICTIDPDFAVSLRKG